MKIPTVTTSHLPKYRLGDVRSVRVNRSFGGSTLLEKFCGRVPADDLTAFDRPPNGLRDTSSRSLMGKKSKQSKEDDTAAATEAVQSEKIKKSSSRARRASRRNDEPAKQDSADSAGSAGTAAAGTSPAPPKDTKGKGKASQDDPAAPKTAASQLSQSPGESLPQGKKMTAPQVSDQTGLPEEASQAEPAAAAPRVTPGHGKHALVTPGDQGDKLSAATAEASPAIGQDAPQPAAAAASGFIKKKIRPAIRSP